MARGYGECGIGPQADAAAGAPRQRLDPVRPCLDPRDYRRHRDETARAVTPRGDAQQRERGGEYGVGAQQLGDRDAWRGRTIWRKPKPLTAVRSNGCGSTASIAAATASAIRLDPASVGRSIPIEPPIASRRIASRRRALPATARAGERQMRRRRRTASSPAWATCAARRRRKIDFAGQRFLEQLGPAGRLELIGLVRGEAADGRAIAGALRALGAARSAMASLARSAGELEAAGLGDRLAHDLDQQQRPCDRPG